MPPVPFSVNSRQTMIAPNLFGLPGAATPVYEFAPLPAAPEAAPAPLFEPDLFDAAPVPPAPPAPPVG